MKVDKSQMLLVVGKVNMATENKGIIEEMSHLVFSKSHAMAFNDKITIVYPFEHDGDSIQASVISSDFMMALKGAGESVELNTKNNHLVLKSSKYVAKIPFYENDKMEEMLETLNIKKAKKKKIKLPDNFLYGLSICKNSASDNLDNLKGLFAVKVDNDHMFSTNGYEAILFTDMGESDIESFFIKKTYIDPIISFSPTHIHVTSHWIYFFNADGGIFCAKTVDVADDFPKAYTDTFNVISKKDKGFKIKMGDSFNVLNFFADGKEMVDKNMRIILDDEALTFVSESEKGKVTVKGKAIGHKGVVNIIVNPSQFRNMVNGKGTFHIAETFICLKTDQFKHLTALRKD